MQPPAALPPFAVAASYFDGETAGSVEVQAIADQAAGTLTLKSVIGGRVLKVWQLDELRVVRDTGHRHGVVFHPFGADVERLVVGAEKDAQALEAVAANLRARHVPKGTTRKVLVWTGAAVGSILLILFVILPNLANTLAVMIPPAREEAIGETVVAQVERMFSAGERGTFCSNPAGDAALAQMSDRLMGELDLPYPLKIRVLKTDMVNAFAAPGGHVVLLSGLIDKASGPDEVAGVLAHEIGHVAARDPLRLTLRAAGSAGILSMVLGDFAGGTLVLIIAEQMISASYSREAEAAADDFAFEMLAEAQISSVGIATFFAKLEDEFGDTEGVMEYLASHPNLGSRATAAREADTAGNGTLRPALNDAEWQALQGICDG